MPELGSQQLQTCVRVERLVASRVPPTLRVKTSLSATGTVAINAFSCSKAAICFFKLPSVCRVVVVNLLGHPAIVA